MGRKSLIKGTEWQDIVDRCIADNWTSAAISLYLRHRYGYEVEESTVRRYRKDNRARIAKDYADVYVEAKQRVFIEAHVADGHIVDHLGMLGEMIRLQRERIEVDLRIESEMNLLSPQTRQEMELLGKMVTQYHEFLQDFGIVPYRAEGGAGIGVPQPTAAISFPLMDVLDDEEKEGVISLSRAIHARQAKAALDAPS